MFQTVDVKEQHPLIIAYDVPEAVLQRRNFVGWAVPTTLMS